MLRLALHRPRVSGGLMVGREYARRMGAGFHFICIAVTLVQWHHRGTRFRRPQSAASVARGRLELFPKLPSTQVPERRRRFGRTGSRPWSLSNECTAARASPSGQTQCTLSGWTSSSDVLEHSARHGREVRKKSRIRRNLQEYDWTLCSGGPGDALGGSGRARGRPLRPADGPDALGAVHAESPAGERG